ncbi:uncharacterized protein LOC127290446 [Leptopilina boulardi]|uniref:uncharacterized protein LOC127290446 n=1 Tax=Leptopilina boulardi TaxID=63433 RepID=UPI0021F5D2D3|nr:uncharacterized protein LOC127290446 [Leptopilina boulardi]XP_051174961.1 uncharacterized protein LOC127290446 [Leptopilina boulardi]
MDTLTFSNPLATVQLIPIVNYINILSNFLYIKKYLKLEEQRNKIVIVNELYKYFDDHRDDQSIIENLIRNLLQGSDLYGERDKENFDLVFVNTMFDYIISSIVFEKYGNIYGFLADTVRKAEQLQYYYVLETIKKTLKNATFENEYGPSSKLSQLSCRRIFNDLILPLFPKPVTKNLNLLSLDYIFTQAGATYLRPGLLNNTYYPNYKNLIYNNIDNEIFNEYMVTGYIIENLLYHNKIDPLAWKIFALPTLFYYISNEDKVKQENITNIIFNPLHWEGAYHNFREYLFNTSVKIENQLMNDSTYKMHQELKEFESRASMARYFIQITCHNMDELTKEVFFSYYIKSTIPLQCGNGNRLWAIDDYFQYQLSDFPKVYEEYELGITQQSFNESILGSLRDVEIKLLITNDKVVDGDFNTSQHLPYDLLQFSYPNKMVPWYYALIRENNTAKLIREVDDPKRFRQIIGPSLDNFKDFANRTILKFANQSTNKLLEELMKYKKDRFISYLNYSDNTPEKSKWWKEFGLSFVPFYPCVSNSSNYNDVENHVCEQDDAKLLQKFPEHILLHLIHESTQNLLSSFGTTIKQVFIKKIVNTTVTNYFPDNTSETIFSSKFDTPINVVYNTLSLHIEEPKFETLCITQKEIQFVETIINYLEKKINQSFTFVNNMLKKFQLPKSMFTIKVGNLYDQSNQPYLLVNSWDNVTGYGYKFVHSINYTNNKSIIAQLRTYYAIKEKIFITPVQNSSNNVKKYIKIMNESLVNRNQIIDVIFSSPLQNVSQQRKIFLKSKNDKLIEINKRKIFMYEINNHLRSESINISFYGISSHDHNDDYCNIDEYVQEKKNTMFCSRHRRFIEKTNYFSTIIRDLLKNKNDTSVEKRMRDILRKYYFRDNSTVTIFFKHWLEDDRFLNPDWTRYVIIDQSGLLNELLYVPSLDNRFISIEEGKKRINSNYTYRERCKIEEGTSVENIINNFNNQKAAYLVKLEDYYAIRNFATTGHERITGDTNEAKLMKLALYKLAIRQSDDSNDEFDSKLYYFESVTNEFYDRHIAVGNIIALSKFTLTSTNNKTAMRFSAFPETGFQNILYEIIFNAPYPRAKIKVDVNQSFREKKVILLPGFEFRIQHIIVISNTIISNYFKVMLNCTSKSTEKDEWYESIMGQINEINS